MKDFRYIDGVSSLALDTDKCVGCGSCVDVCPHRILAVRERKTTILDFDACMECGACARNCPVEAITVTPGTGCAAYLVSVWLHRLTGRKIDAACC
ncbi:4Fe-4S ferredoxin iron-sulfur binding domain protein [Pseudodesulfovibrio mercurii]|uniref:Ferredoxin n=1 Tax=Pseudodesulfovibrio mercurii TaxID=641491 RepID=F0JBF1_9BACT|nr:mercury methylation ferredoxin HgcB [Pseudodesulfovibrio mercurii]EGB14270.1 4Fe-4S ferredoxin iron-sulfur binding domain protein [Pseudodesulfovibrio mercurii]